MQNAHVPHLSGAELVIRGYIHPSATLGPDVEVAEEASVGPNCYVTGRTKIGANSTLTAGVTLLGDVLMGANCVLEPNVSMTNNLIPVHQQCSPLIIGTGSRVGAGSVLASGVRIGPHAQIGAGTVVVRDVPAHAIVAGNPATIIGYATPPALGGASMFKSIDNTMGTTVAECSVRGVRVFKFPRIRDLRGDLSVGEFGRNVPFLPKRYFLVFDVPSAETRGEHAHRLCEQFLICASGRVSVVVDDGSRREEIELDAPNIGLYIPPRVWALQYKYDRHATLLVFASHYYDADDYIRDYQQFIMECKAPQ